MQNLWEARNVISHIIQQRRPVLVPYDAAPNHMPARKGGASCHWCAVVGVLLPLPQHPVLQHVTEHLSSVPDEPRLLLCEKALPAALAEEVLAASASQAWVIATQGRSRHWQAWRCSELLESNSELIRAAAHRVADGRWRIPETLHDLQHHIILL